MKSARLLMLLVTICLAPTSATARPASLPASRIDAIVAKAMSAFSVPGVALAVVQPDGSIYAKGHGVTAVGTSTPTSADTLFGIGSITKAFTTTGIAMLVAEGKLDWNDRVIDHLPEFRMADPWVTREFTVRDLVTHRSGLPPYAGDLVTLTSGKANKQGIYRALAHLQPATSFRTRYAYDNLLYVVAGDLIERLSGMSWQDYTERRILEPLGMDGCAANLSRVSPRRPRSSAHETEMGSLTVVDFPLPSVIDPAGGIVCNAHGMMQWLRLNIGEASVGGSLPGESGMANIFKPVMQLPVGDMAVEFGRSNFAAYGLGWFVRDSYGRLQAEHGGGLPGMVSYISVFPSSKTGVMVMTNRSSAAARAISLQIFEEMFSDEPRDAITKFADMEKAAVKKAEASVAALAAKPRASAKPSLDLPQYAGRYTDPWFGDVEVRNQGGKLVLDLGSQDLTGTLEYYDRDSFIARWANRKLNADAFVNFQLDATGRIEGIKMSAISATTDPSFDFHDLDLRRKGSSDSR